MTRKHTSTATLTYVALFAALIAICTWITIPGPVPFTMQTFAVFAAVGLLGWKLGTVSVLVYILIGALGLPVFAGFQAGFGVLFGMTGGYILGFIVSAIVTGLLIKHFGQSTVSMAISMVIGLILCYALGTVWFVVLYTQNTGAISVFSALTMCVFPFIIPDLLKIALAIFITKTLARHIHL